MVFVNFTRLICFVSISCLQHQVHMIILGLLFFIIEIMMPLNPLLLEDLVKTHAKMRAAESCYKLQIPFPEKLKDAQEEDDAAILQSLQQGYDQAYQGIHKELGYLSVLTADQMAFYLDSHLKSMKTKVMHSTLSDEQMIANSVDKANYHFQLRAYAAIAIICPLTVCLLFSIAVFAGMLSTPILFLDLVIFESAVATSLMGFSAWGIFSAAKQIKPTAEEMISYEPTYNFPEEVGTGLEFCV